MPDFITLLNKKKYNTTLSQQFQNQISKSQKDAKINAPYTQIFYCGPSFLVNTLK